MCGNSRFSVDFGNGDDIVISDCSNENQKSNCNFGCSYELLKGMEFGSDKAKGIWLGRIILGFWIFKFIRLVIEKFIIRFIMF